KPLEISGRAGFCEVPLDDSWARCGGLAPHLILDFCAASVPVEPEVLGIGLAVFRLVHGPLEAPSLRFEQIAVLVAAAVEHDTVVEDSQTPRELADLLLVFERSL